MASHVRLTGQVHTEAADHIPAVTTFSTPREAPTARRTAAKDAFRNVSPKKEIEVSPVYQVYRERKGSAVSPERKAWWAPRATKAKPVPSVHEDPRETVAKSEFLVFLV
jgi:hypothetical protein